MSELAVQCVKDFMTAFGERNETGMKGYLTSSAKDKFNPGILEDVRELSDFSIISQEGNEESYTVRGQVKVTTPDHQVQTETWEFKLKKEGDNLLIDSWGEV